MIAYFPRLTPYSLLVPDGTSDQKIKDKINRWRLTSIGIVYSALVIVTAIIHITVVPKIQSLYIDLHQPLPWITKTSPWISASLLIILGAITLITLQHDQPSYTSVKTQEGFLQITPRMATWRTELFLIIGFGILVALTMFTVVSPIYSLTG